MLRKALNTSGIADFSRTRNLVICFFSQCAYLSTKPSKNMFGTNKPCLKGIYLPTFQRSVILRANEGYNKCTRLFTQLDNVWREKLVSLLVSFICIVGHCFVCPSMSGF